MRSRTGSSIALAIVVGVLIFPAGAAAAGPIEDIGQRAIEPVSQSVDRAGAALPAVRQVVERSTARVRPTVEAVTGSEPIRTAVQSVTTSVGRVAPQAEPTVAATVGQLTPHTPDSSSPSRYAVGHPNAGGIDRHASRRSGGPQGGIGNAADNVASLPQTTLGTIASTAAEQARSDASSTLASSDGGLDIGQPPFGFDDGGSALGGPAGIALLGLLAAILALIPRFSTRLLHMSPARWGLVAFLVPIERPG